MIRFRGGEAKLLRVLVFDMEARPIAWYGGDFVTKQVTAVASAYTDDPEGTLEVQWLTKDDRTFTRMLKHMASRLEEADVVAGHYIRGFDLPLLNGNLFIMNLPLLGKLLTQDTKGDLPKLGGLSKSMENLGSELELDHGKVGMNTGKWYDANTLTPEGIELSKERVAGDVLENIELYHELKARGALSPPKVWDPGSIFASPQYTP